VAETGSFWATGDLVYTHRFGIYEEVTFRHFDVRFEPESVYAIINRTPGEPVAPDPEDSEIIAKGVPVSRTHLEAWYELYRQAYRGADDTEDTALKSAKGMFPGKAVSREKIRELRGPQKRGRKPGELAK
jgi:hypothetical protein